MCLSLPFVRALDSPEMGCHKLPVIMNGGGCSCQERKRMCFEEGIGRVWVYVCLCVCMGWRGEVKCILVDMYNINM